MAEDLGKLRIGKGAAKPPRRRGRIVAIAALVALAAVFVYVTLARPVIIETASVTLSYPSQDVTLLNASGYVVAQRKAAVAAKVTGRLEWLGVEEGSRVSRGQILARLESRDAAAAQEQAVGNLAAARENVEQARAEFHDAELSHTRLKGLLAEGVVSQADFDSAEARLKKARAGLRGAQSSVAALGAAVKLADTTVEYSVIRAPFDAVVLTKNADVGDIVTPLGAAANAKAAVVTIADLDSLEVEADVSESNLNRIRPGQPCEIMLDALPDQRFSGSVHTIVPTADRSKATIMVKVAFLDKDRRILPEMSAKVAFLERPVGKDSGKPRLVVPAEAVGTFGAQHVAYTVRDNVAVRTVIVTGRRIGGGLEVLSGLKAGDKVVVKPLERMKDRTTVRLPEK